VLATLVGIPYVRPARWRRRQELRVRLDCEHESTVLPAVLTALRSSSLVIGEIDVRDRSSHSDRRIVITLEAPTTMKSESLAQRLSSIAGVHAVRVREHSG
jgi:(p)ppGpp synthase/HD superfamily hydrolase